MKFLIDECLHTSLVQVAVARGHDATHVTYRGWSGAPDWTLMRPILDEDFTFVTNNAKDFSRLYAREPIHAGLIIVVPNVPPAQQRILYDAALDEIASTDGLVNEAIEVRFVSAGIRIARYEWPHAV